jgi:hypothetical protein
LCREGGEESGSGVDEKEKGVVIMEGRRNRKWRLCRGGRGEERVVGVE